MGCTSDGAEWRLQLEELERQNRADSLMTNDSLARSLTEYFDRHGSPNERMRAHYILGRTYADRGEAPAALNSYLDAAESADTCAKDCDFHTLCRVYGQMSGLFYSQNLIDDYMKCLNRSVYYAWMARDTVEALNEHAHKVVAYIRKNQTDSALATFDEVYSLMLQCGKEGMAAKYCTLPVNSLLEIGQLEKAIHYLDLYEKASGFFDDVGNVEKGKEIYYYYRALCYMQCNRVDSAEYLLKKELYTTTDFTNQNAASRLLSSLYKQTNRLDSAIKYSLYSYEMLDSLYAQMSMSEVAQMQAMHNYSRYQHEVEKEKKVAEREREGKALLSLIVFAMVLSSGIALAYWHRTRRKAVERMRRTLAELWKTKADLDRLRSQVADVQVLRSLNEEQSKELDRQNALLSSKDILLQQMEKKLQDQILEREDTERKLQTEMSRYGKVGLSESDRISIRLQQSDDFSLLEKRAKKGQSLSSEEWKKTFILVKNVLPEAYHFISAKCPNTDSSEYRTCILFSLGYGVKDVSNMLNVSKAYISKISRTMLRNFFGEDGSGKEFSKRLQHLDRC